MTRKSIRKDGVYYVKLDDIKQAFNKSRCEGCMNCGVINDAKFYRELNKVKVKGKEL